MSTATDYFFVYGTLKLNHLRESCWPHKPVSIRTAFVRGRLLDLGEYPGLILPQSSSSILDGKEWVQGELWEIQDRHLELTFKTLDLVEGFEEGGTSNLYERVRIDVFQRPIAIESNASLAGSELDSQDRIAIAWSYLFNENSKQAPNTLVLPDRTESGFDVAIWRGL